MCLKIEKGEKPVVAEEPIECYKVLYKLCGEYYGAFYGQKYRLKKQEKLLGYWRRKKFMNVRGDECRLGLHTYANLKDAEDLCRLLKVLTGSPSKKVDYVVVRCVIPKGAHYYTGRVDNGFVVEEINGDYSMYPIGYCSDAIRVKNVVFKNNSSI